ncbi:MAG: 4a-hydroxytetrahydrobiopterin dehydratase [Candidatus Bathyarchaeia archaeon]
MDLAEKRCIPCEGNIAPFSREEAEKYIARVKGWSLADGQIVKEFKFKDFREALGFVNRLGDLAEAEGHHPNILLYDHNHVRLS